jgi:hypothetical protein
MYYNKLKANCFIFIDFKYVYMKYKNVQSFQKCMNSSILKNFISTVCILMINTALIYNIIYILLYSEKLHLLNYIEIYKQNESVYACMCFFIYLTKFIKFININLYTRQ